MAAKHGSLKTVLDRDSQSLRRKYLEKFLDQLKKIMVIGESKQT